MKNIYIRILHELSVNSRIALATITATSGSTPQKPGSSALFSPGGLISGTIGGGILEEKVFQMAKKSFQSEKSGIYYFNLDHPISRQDEAICGGEVTVLLDSAIKDHVRVFEQVRNSITDRIPGVLVTRVTKTGNDPIQVQRSWITRYENPGNQSEYIPGLESAVSDLLTNGMPGAYRAFSISDKEKEVTVCLEPVHPYPRLVIAGAGHIGKALAHLGSLLEFDVLVMDERVEYANPGNIQDADQLVVDDIGEAMMSLKKTPDTYIVIVTPGHKNDADALRSCIGSEAGYIGMIGSKNKIALMRTSFIEKGWCTPDQWQRVFAPVGLDIHSETVQEIAVSIAAQLIKVKNGKVNAYE